MITRDLLPGRAFTPDGDAVISVYGGKLHRLDLATGRERLIPCLRPRDGQFATDKPIPAKLRATGS